MSYQLVEILATIVAMIAIIYIAFNISIGAIAGFLVGALCVESHYYYNAKIKIGKDSANKLFGITGQR